jgi:predicted phosphoadenosine phosphosulfate sulfurtransferase
LAKTERKKKKNGEEFRSDSSLPTFEGGSPEDVNLGSPEELSSVIDGDPGAGAFKRQAGVKPALVYSDRTCYELARERISYLYDKFDTVAVAFSGGKDSTATLHVTLDEAIARNRLPLEAIFYDEEVIPYQTEEYVRRVVQSQPVNLRWFCLPVKHRNACSHKEPYWHPYDPRCPEKWVRPIPPEGLTHLDGFNMSMTTNAANGLMFPAKDYGRTVVLLGIRAQESLVRYRYVTAKRVDNYIMKFRDATSQFNMYKGYPIYDWRTEDVWTAPQRFGWDYNRAYDAMDKAGIVPHAQRCAPPFGEEPMRGIWMFKVCFPEIWEKMCVRVQGASAAARYASTVLYAFVKTPEKPPNMTWEDWILKWLSKFNPDEQRWVAHRLKFEIQNHYRKTKDPILWSAEHPVSGVSWQYITKLVVRGDLKKRRQPIVKSAGTPEYDLACKKYKDALDRFNAGDANA